ncbi:diguanylate cyclase [Clostridium sp. chh4-2]|uniref:bifunctional diguanylate cyclase/phosphohydrolase n=1 Tax=Clostridium sp. chh4-2 TaxID=2067550 RepID=UPI000CCFB53A|nr:diguanylate cyclase [Clostridium sp. chh4-2]PNV62940.1 diguanylate cyclase [Clostridium sp. chh4-2]
MADKKQKILIVDDTEFNRALLTDMLMQEYEILEAVDGLEAITVINKHSEEISLILLDIVMPRMDGFEVLAILNKSGLINTIPVITISSETSSINIDRAYDLGVTDYIARPFDGRTVQRRVKNTLLLYTKQKQLESLVTEQILEKEKTNLLMVEILSNIVEFRNGESGLHVLHIQLITELLLRRMVQITDQYPLSSSQITLISNAAALHDVGKISISEEILNKPGKLTDEEFEIMKQHTVIGAQIIENTPYGEQEELVSIARDICRWHHERYDGSGYPDHLKGDEIPISAQVVSLADAYDALTSARVYKPAYSHDKAIEMIIGGECGEFNPMLIQCLLDIGERMKEKLQINSPGDVTKAEMHQFVRELLSQGQASNRTLALLEQERTKYQFFAAMSKEIQFEYNMQTDMLSFSEWGAAFLGIRELITHPGVNKDLLGIISKQDFEDLADRILKTTSDNPVVSCNYQINVHGSARWFKIVARSLWVGDDPGELTGMIGKCTDVHDEHIQVETLKQMADQDPLTKLYNHRSVRQAIEKILVNGQGRHFALILFDLDHFKNANDQHGHLFGDNVLKYTAQRAIDSIRKEDIAARVGGDEFVIFIEFRDEIEPVVSRIFNSLVGQCGGFSISVSMGVSLYPEHGTNYEELFGNADQALYYSKQNGRRQFNIYNHSVQGFLSAISPMDNELATELKKDE